MRLGNWEKCRLNAVFYRSDGELVDVVAKWINEIKVLGPGQEVVCLLNRKVGEYNADTKEFVPFVAERAEIQVASFSVNRPKKKTQSP